MSVIKHHHSYVTKYNVLVPKLYDIGDIFIRHKTYRYNTNFLYSQRQWRLCVLSEVASPMMHHHCAKLIMFPGTLCMSLKRTWLWSQTAWCLTRLLAAATQTPSVNIYNWNSATRLSGMNVTLYGPIVVIWLIIDIGSIRTLRPTYQYMKHFQL